MTADQRDHLARLTASLEYADSLLQRQQNKSQVKAENDAENEKFETYPLDSYVWLTSHKSVKGRSPKFLQKFSGPHRIIEIKPPVNYRLQTPSGKILKSFVHHDRLKPHRGAVPDSKDPEKVQIVPEETWEEDDDIPLAELLRRMADDKEDNIALADLKKQLKAQK